MEQIQQMLVFRIQPGLDNCVSSQPTQPTNPYRPYRQLRTKPAWLNYTRVEAKYIAAIQGINGPKIFNLTWVVQGKT